MTDAAPGPAEVGDPPAGEDPLAADKRTLTIGAISMVGLILIGVVSAQLFARGGCAAVVDPEPAVHAAEGQAPVDVVADTLQVDGEAIVAAVEAAAGAPVTAALAVGDAADVVAFGEGLLTTGRTITSLDPSLAPVATFDSDDPVVGDGPAVHHVVLPNQRTGQTDALVPLTGSELSVGTCVDTAVVGSPFAFLLGAGDGQLLLFRAEEDGDAPTLQLRDAEAGVLWDTPLEQPAGPPGTLAERLSAALGPDTVVAARRVGPQEEATAPAVAGFGRGDGTARFELAGPQLAAAAELDDSAAIRWEVAAVGRDTALLHGRPDPSDAEQDADPRGDGALVLVDLADGEVVTAVTGLGPLRRAAADLGASSDRFAVATARPGSDDQEDVLVVDADGARTPFEGPVTDAVLAWGEGVLLIGGPERLARLDLAAGSVTAETVEDVNVRAITTTPEGRLAVLLTRTDAEGADDGGEAADGEAVLVITTRDDGLVSAPAVPAGG
ncbi:MAG: hypothetical protein WEB09_07410 [Nitriliruptor sp.]